MEVGIQTQAWPLTLTLAQEAMLSAGVVKFRIQQSIGWCVPLPTCVWHKRVRGVRSVVVRGGSIGGIRGALPSVLFGIWHRNVHQTFFYCVTNNRNTTINWVPMTASAELGVQTRVYSLFFGTAEYFWHFLLRRKKRKIQQPIGWCVSLPGGVWYTRGSQV